MVITDAAVFNGLVPFDGHRTLEAHTYQRLREAITIGSLAPGAKLVGSRLATELGVSRITIANALKRLASEGFVTVTPHKEAIVASLDEASLAEIFTIRYALEAIVMRAVAQHIAPETIDQLREINTQLSAAAEREDLAAYRQGERAFHLTIYHAAALPLTATLLTDLWDRVEPYRGQRYHRTGLRHANHDEHEAMITLLATHNGEAAERAMHHHVASGYERYVQVVRALQLDIATVNT